MPDLLAQKEVMTIEVIGNSTRAEMHPIGLEHYDVCTPSD
jgi:hypothetical protein